ncbi:hypothetical protein BGX34_004364 [Mortierella sp. NVP85]|nr:hypothetical protein BGX34_004364 [Mortierella sp. NVP85]
MQSFTDFIKQAKDRRKGTFQTQFRSYSESHGDHYKKLKQRPPHLSFQKHLQEYTKTVADLEEAERREKADKAATRTSEKVTDAVTTMIDGTLNHITSSHIRSLKRPNDRQASESSNDDDFEQPASARKKTKKDAQSTVDPWMALEQACIRLHNGERGVSLPHVPTDLPSNHLQLFRIAHQCLADANGPLKKDTDMINLKDAIAAFVSYCDNTFTSRRINAGLNYDSTSKGSKPFAFAF